MQLQSPYLADYLQCTPIIDWETPAIIEQTQAITRPHARHGESPGSLRVGTGCHSPFLGYWDGCRHLHRQRGASAAHRGSATPRVICWPPCSGVRAFPPGFCYQVFRRSPPYNGLALHGLNSLYLPSVARWVRVDARGNTDTIDAQFSLTEEKLAFPVDPHQGEFLYETICNGSIS